MPAPLQTVVMVAAALAVVALAAAALSWGRPATTMTAHTSASTQRVVQFRYTATVPPSAAYDSTTVSSPQPVFRTQTDTVVVHYIYRGVPATLDTSLTLSAANGWTSTRTITSPAKVGSTYRGSTTLDLAALSDRAAAAASVIGASTADLTVTVGLHIVPQTGKAFTATYPLSLSPLRLARGGPALGTSSAGPSETRMSLVPATVTLGPMSPRVSTVRRVSLLLLVVSALSVAIALVLARRAPAVSEAESILREHAALIVPVSPVPSPNGRPIAEVTDFTALAKLAERYGLAVLHWERSGVATFVVHDEGVTYRYRTPSRTGPVSAGDAEPPGHAIPPAAPGPGEPLAPQPSSLTPRTGRHRTGTR